MRWIGNSFYQLFEILQYTVNTNNKHVTKPLLIGNRKLTSLYILITFHNILYILRKSILKYHTLI